jgi:membrane-bound ClpP family serine protease
MFPIVLITLGLMFLAEHLVPGWGIHRTWPVLLVVIGVLKLIDATQPPRPPEGPRV